MSNLLTVAQRRLDRGEQPGDVLNQASEELGAAQVEMRDLARGLHPVALSERGLRNALESLTVGAETSVTVDVTEDELPAEVELAVYFVVSESLTNARKYAGARAVQVRVAPVADALLVEVVDDGCGGADPGCRDGPARAGRPDRRAGRQPGGRQPARRRDPRQRAPAAARIRELATVPTDGMP